MQIDLEGAAIVTGAGRGIGAAIARRLAASGASVALASRTPSEVEAVAASIREAGGAARAFRADVTDEAQVEALFAGAVEAFGPLRYLVNNAGNAPVGPTADFSLADWQHCLGVNLTGAFLCSRQAFRTMPAAGGGAIVNVSSGAGKHGKAMWAAYCAAKSGLHGLARALAAEGTPLGIRVNTVCPGGTRTTLRASIFGEEPEGKILAPEQVADAVLFLLSDAAADIRGAELDVRKP
ncbi:MAG: SDR family NAD(P)-dependent oxidoreductase [Deltaproteobacteria bacterium]|nr:SDR family NAD(P)-dependent oxidoreductase [Deltaproteobacteria bacterium]